MEAVLTVRLDKETKERGVEILQKRGFSPSQAVRSLFDYVVSTSSLPFEEKRLVSSEEVQRKIAAFDKCHTKTPLALSDEEIRAERIRERYGIDV